MKYLLLLLLVFGVLWVARGWRPRAVRNAAARQAEAPSAVGHEELPACAHCGMYLPSSEALVGPDGVFCSEAHRQAARAREPAA